MEQPPPLTRKQLQEIARRQRGKADVRRLLLEIKRLRGVVQEAYRCARRVTHYTENADQAAALDAFISSILDEPAIAEMDPPQRPSPPQGKAPQGKEGPRWPHMSAEREAKLLARMRRG